MEHHQFSHEFSQEQKTGLVLLLSFGVLTVGLGFLQIRNTIYNPFSISAPDPVGTQQASALLDETTRLQTIDTDQDGLNDYEELNFIQTSPYLPDTDSDGITDKQEVDNGTDPLCAEGKNCGESELPAKTEGLQVGSGLVNGSPGPLDALGSGGLGGAEVAAQNGAPEQSVGDVQKLIQDPAELRKTIIATGKISEAELAKFDDETLIKTFGSLFQQQANTVVPQGN
jgi:hypothetical protein